jgi:hypothetical protein
VRRAVQLHGDSLLFRRESSSANVANGSVSTRHEPDIKGGELTFKMSGIEVPPVA